MTILQLFADNSDVKNRRIRSLKIDCRMSPELWHKVDDFAQAAHLSRSQVVERALLAFFGEEVPEKPPVKSKKQK